MPSEGGIILWLLALLCVSVVSAPQISDCFLFSIRKMRAEKLATLFAGRRPRFPPTAKLGWSPPAGGRVLVRMSPGARGLMGGLRLRNINMNLPFCLTYRLREYLSTKYGCIYVICCQYD
jgi:hypothetical protein